jgi:hypothetical protein
MSITAVSGFIWGKIQTRLLVLATGRDITYRENSQANFLTIGDGIGMRLSHERTVPNI